MVPQSKTSLHSGKPASRREEERHHLRPLHLLRSLARIGLSAWERGKQLVAPLQTRLSASVPPYPMTIAPAHRFRNAEGTEGLETFDSPAARSLNRARMEHLDSLGLPLSGKSVLDVGCGVGHLAQYFVERG